MHAWKNTLAKPFHVNGNVSIAVVGVVVSKIVEGVVVMLAVDFAVVGVVVVGKVARNDIVVLGVDVVVLLAARVWVCALVQGEMQRQRFVACSCAGMWVVVGACARVCVRVCVCVCVRLALQHDSDCHVLALCGVPLPVCARVCVRVRA